MIKGLEVTQNIFRDIQDINHFLYNHTVMSR